MERWGWFLMERLVYLQEVVGCWLGLRLFQELLMETLCSWHSEQSAARLCVLGGRSVSTRDAGLTHVACAARPRSSQRGSDQRVACSRPSALGWVQVPKLGILAGYFREKNQTETNTSLFF